MKIGIITFHCAHNYGAVLQAYALTRYLQNVGHDVHVIDYRPSFLTAGYSKRGLQYWLSKNPFRAVKKLLTEPFLMHDRKLRWDKFEEFISRLPLVPVEELQDGCQFDVVIYGSDQIWNPDLTGGMDEVYWGKYSKGKSVSYAASMGEYVPDKEAACCVQNLLKNFMKISVRESAVAKILADLTETPVRVVCDPIFLLSSDDWERVLPNPQLSTPYILCYNLLHNPDCKKEALTISREKGLRLIEITGIIQPHFGDSVLQALSPLEFVSYIRHAEYVVTSSFHGTAFSLLFQIPFKPVGLGVKAGRVEHLLSRIKYQPNSSSYVTALTDYIKESKLFLSEI